MRQKAAFLALAILGAGALLGACRPAEPVIVTQEVRVVETEQVQVNVPVEFVMESARLEAVRGRDRLVCGVNTSVPGFGFVDANGQNVGFDIDICRAIAAAIFGDAGKVEFRPLTAAERFTALQTNEIDVLSRNTTWTMGRDVELGTDFAPTTFYDGQGMLVRKDSNFASLNDMAGATICVLAGTPTEANLAAAFNTRGLEYEPVVLDTGDATVEAYDGGRCDGLTSDRSQLAGLRTRTTNPADHIILADVMSKEPLGPVWAQGDQQWCDLVRWVVYSLIISEEKGITQANVAEIAASDPKDPEVRRMLGIEGEFGALLGLEPDFVVDVITAVGNYGEIYERHLGPAGTDIPREGTLNALWSDGGMIYAPPWR